jgi:transposase
LNRAIDAAAGEYLIFTDGDCVPRDDFVAEHQRLARVGRFLSGGTFRLPRGVTNRILDDSVATKEFTDASWLRRDGVPLPAKWIWIQRHCSLAKWVDLATTTQATFNGHNSSAWKRDVVRANGFNHQMRYGGVDRELGERLENCGVTGMQIRHRALCFHLDHDRGYETDADWKRNRDIRKQVRRRCIQRAEEGLDQIRSLATRTRRIPSVGQSHDALTMPIHRKPTSAQNLFCNRSLPKQQTRAAHQLTDDQWNCISDLFPPRNTPGRPPVNFRLAVGGILWILRTGSPWRDLPEELGNWRAIHGLFDAWNGDGTIDVMLYRLRMANVRGDVIDEDLWFAEGTPTSGRRYSGGVEKTNQTITL